MQNWTQIVTGLAFIGGVFIVDCFLLVERPEGMVWVKPGALAANPATPGVTPAERHAHKPRTGAFWIDRTAVTNLEFAAFIKANADARQNHADTLGGDFLVVSGWQDDAEHVGSGDGRPMLTSVQLRNPPGSNADQQNAEQQNAEQQNAEQQPGFQLSYEDARAYCRWVGKELASTAQFEFAARMPARPRSSVNNGGFRCVINRQGLRLPWQ